MNVSRTTVSRVIKEDLDLKLYVKRTAQNRKEQIESHMEFQFENQWWKKFCSLMRNIFNLMESIIGKVFELTVAAENYSYSNYL